MATATAQPVASCRQVFGALSIYAVTAKQPATAAHPSAQQAVHWVHHMHQRGSYWPQRIAVLLIMCIINIFIAF